MAARCRRVIGSAALCVALVAGLGGCAGFSPVSGADAQGGASAGVEKQAAELSLVHEGALTVACPLDCLPYFQDANGVQTGFGCELMDAVAQRLDVEVAWSKADSADAALARAQVAGQTVRGAQVRADAAMTVADAVSGQVGSVVADDASGMVRVPFVDVSQCLVAKKSSAVESVDDLGGCKVGVLAGSPGAAWAASSLADVQLVEFNNVVELFSALQARNVDAVVADEQAANYHLRVSYGDEHVVQHIEEADAGYALAFDAGNEALAQAVAQALCAMREDSYQQLCDAWFSEADNSRGKVEARTPEQGAPGHDKGGGV